MLVYNFTNDYSEGCHPSILEALVQSNLEQEPGYGEDRYTRQAVAAIRDLTGDPQAAVHLVSGGTQANLIILASILKPFESVITAETGHIHVHEAGAVEATGHKIEVVTTPDGKLRPDHLQPLLNKFPKYHTVRPRVVCIANSTEIGTIYTKKELAELSLFCRANQLVLFMDGARLPAALAAAANDLTLADITGLVDIFYLGGTKSGALLGEAIVITREELKEDFKYHLKQRGALMAKGRVLGVQFAQLLKDDLLFRLARHANALAMRIAEAVNTLGYSWLTTPVSNQLFPILPLRVIEGLRLRYGFFVWQSIDEEYAALRLITSWATPDEVVDGFIRELKRLSYGQ